MSNAQNTSQHDVNASMVAMLAEMRAEMIASRELAQAQAKAFFDVLAATPDRGPITQAPEHVAKPRAKRARATREGFSVATGPARVYVLQDDLRAYRVDRFRDSSSLTTWSLISGKGRCMKEGTRDEKWNMLVNAISHDARHMVAPTGYHATALANGMMMVSEKGTELQLYVVGFMGIGAYRRYLCAGTEFKINSVTRDVHELVFVVPDECKFEEEEEAAAAAG